MRRYLGLAVAGFLLAAAIPGYFLVSFFLKFEAMGPPVRDGVHGWLGPTPRGNVTVTDIGKVNFWESDDISVFRDHALACKVWLWMNGLPQAEVKSLDEDRGGSAVHAPNS